MSSREITLWLDERWYQALSQQLEVKKLEDKLNEYLDDLISLLPSQVYDQITGEIHEEEQQREQALAASQKFAAFRITENGVVDHFRTEDMAGMVETAIFVRRWLRQTEQHPFQEILSNSKRVPGKDHQGNPGPDGYPRRERQRRCPMKWWRQPESSCASTNRRMQRSTAHWPSVL